MISIPGINTPRASTNIWNRHDENTGSGSSRKYSFNKPRINNKMRIQVYIYLIFIFIQYLNFNHFSLNNLRHYPLKNIYSPL